MTLDDKIKTFVYAKKQENYWRKKRQSIEKLIANSFLGKIPEGQSTKYVGDFKIILSWRMKRRVRDGFLDFKTHFPENLWPIKLKPVVDLKILRSIELFDSELSSLTDKFIDREPGAISVKVEGGGND